MRKATFILFFFLSFLVCTTIVYAETETLPCTLIMEFPHNPAASTQGLFFHEGTLYESSGGYGRSFLAKVDLKTGRHLQTVPLKKTYFAEGMAPFEDSFRLLTWRSGTGFIYGLKDMKKRTSFTYRKQSEMTEGWGLAFDGTHFILSSGTDTLRFHAPKDFTLTKTVTVTDNNMPVRLLNELEYVNGLLYANIWKSDIMVIIDPKSGLVQGRIDLSPLRERLSEDSGVANGIAFNAQTGRLYVTGKHWNKLFEIEIPKF
nr:glutaminyl-peptide cyclotransferase [uncultured Pseudodesulfovibrio sp.]